MGRLVKFYGQRLHSEKAPSWHVIYCIEWTRPLRKFNVSRTLHCGCSFRKSPYDVMPPVGAAVAITPKILQSLFSWSATHVQSFVQIESISRSHGKISFN